MINLKLNKSFLLLCALAGLYSCGKNEGDLTPQNEDYEFNAPANFGTFTIPASNPTTTRGVDLGKKLFFDKLLSIDNTVSCASCHLPEFAFSDTIQFSEGIRGQRTKRNSPPIANLLWMNRFFWDGRSESLEAQAIEPILSKVEMGLTRESLERRLRNHSEYPSAFKLAFENSDLITSDLVSKALAQYMRSLISSDSKYDQYLKGTATLSDNELLGEQLFFTHPEPSLNLRGANCGDCHVAVLTSGASNLFEGFHNNGLDNDANLENGLFSVTKKITDKGKFKTPSLRNVELTAPYMHDGRFKTLEEVLAHYNEHIQVNSNLSHLITEASNDPSGNPLGDNKIKLDLTATEQEAIIAFLKTLTDSNFIKKHTQL